MHRGEVRRGHVVHVHEVPHLAAARKPCGLPFQPPSGRSRPLGSSVARYAGAVDAVVAQRHHRTATRFRPRQRSALRGLAGRVPGCAWRNVGHPRRPIVTTTAAFPGNGARRPAKPGRLAAAAAGSTGPRCTARRSRQPPSTTPAPNGGPRRRTFAPAAPWWRNVVAAIGGCSVGGVDAGTTRYR